MSRFAPATREATKARIALSGPPGSGKSWTALMIAHVLGDRIAGIDTERRSLSKYKGVNGWDFHTSTPTTFEPSDLVSLLAEAGQEGFDVVLVDSFTHYWSGSGGMLDQVDRRTRNNNTFGTGWKEMRPEERAMIDAILSYPGHVIVTLRVKTEYVVEENDRGKKEPRKVGLKPDQREGIEYEFDLVADLDQDNILTVTKSRLTTIPNREMVKEPGVDWAARIKEWTDTGDPTVNARDLYARVMADDVTAADVFQIGNEVIAAGLEHAAVVGPAAITTTLMNLVRFRMKEIEVADNAHAAVAPPENAATDIGDGGAPV